MEPVAGGSARLHREVAGPFNALVLAAAKEGFGLSAASGFRSFARQLALWNAKARGDRPVLDEQGGPVDLASLTPPQQAAAILRWSGLPGASRHHWGTDVDVFDTRAVPAGAGPRLLPEEYEAGGLFFPLRLWLDGNAERYGFFRPYLTDRGGVAPEPWHLSAAPLAQTCLASYDRVWLERLVSQTPDFALRETVLGMLPAVELRFIRACDPEPFLAS